MPRISRLVALAIYMQELVNVGAVADYAELACLGQASRARITQIMNLLHLAPDIQEEILNLPRAEGGADPITEKKLRRIAAVTDWDKQRAMWGEVKGESRELMRASELAQEASGTTLSNRRLTEVALPLGKLISARSRLSS